MNGRWLQSNIIFRGVQSMIKAPFGNRFSLGWRVCDLLRARRGIDAVIPRCWRCPPSVKEAALRPMEPAPAAPPPMIRLFRCAKCGLVERVVMRMAPHDRRVARRA
jgi:hypothetical protein